MKFTTNAGELARVLGHVKGCVPARVTIPILSHVEVVANKQTVTIRATNLEREAWSSCDADVSVAGAVAVPGMMLQSIVSRMPKGSDVSLTVDGGRCSIVCGRSKYETSVVDLDAFPERREPTGDVARISVSAADIRRLSAATRNSTVSTSDRPALAGVTMKTDATNSGVRLVALASDGIEAVRAWCETSSIDKIDGAAIVPVDVLREIDTICEDGDVVLTFSDSRMSATSGAATITSALIDAQPFPIEQIIPPVNGALMTCLAHELADALDRAMTAYTGLDTRVSAIVLSTDDGVAMIDTEKGKQNAGHEEVDCDVVEIGKSFVVDGKALRGLVGAWGEKPISIQHEGGMAKILIRSDKDERMVQVLMPMRR